MSCNYFQSNYPDCTDCSKGKKIVANEKRRKYTAENVNSKTICKVRIDDCVIVGSSIIKCDYLFLVCDDSTALFIELKGQNMSHAIDQIEASIAYLSTILKNFSINARIVLSKVNTPDIQSSKLVKFKHKIKKLGGDVIYESRQMVERIE